MNKTEIIHSFDIKTDHKRVLAALECAPGNPMYAELEALCRRMEGRLADLLEPEAVFVFDRLDQSMEGLNEEVGTEAVFVLFTVGAKISDFVEAAFKRDSYMEGMLLDAMADDYLFQMQQSCEDQLQELCRERGYGIRKRLEAPIDIPAEMQEHILNKIRQQCDSKVTLTAGYMFQPVKTCAYILLLSSCIDDKVSFHDCRKCSRRDCSRRHLPVILEVLHKSRADEIECTENKSIHTLLTEQGYQLPAPCAGRGTCGKCRIQLENGSLPPTEADRRELSEEELEAGYRLACQAYPRANCTIVLPETDRDIKAVAASVSLKGEMQGNYPEYVIAVDIGTTTLAFQLSDKHGKRLAEQTALNRQNVYGADVVARQLAAVSGKAAELQELIRGDLAAGIAELFRQTAPEVTADKIGKAVIACNTTMSHLLMGYSCEGLGKYPYQPVSIAEIPFLLAEVTGREEWQIPGVIVPGISTYVGGDITAGLLACAFEAREKPALLLDLGTNGEMVLGNKERLLVTATAAGPAFEGGNISWGTGSIPGAISKVTIEDGSVKIETIGGKEPVGICGTGLMECVAELIRNDIIDDTGLLEENWFEAGFPLAKTSEGQEITVTQKDIRAFQTAKGAIRAGIELLLQKYGIGYEEIDTLCLAGGFGFWLDISKAVQAGLIPAELEHKVKVAGNTALGGAVCYADPEEASAVTGLIQAAEEIHLSKTEEFQELFLKHMYFS